MVLVAIDKHWQEHLYNMDALREGVAPPRPGSEGPARRIQERGLQALRDSSWTRSSRKPSATSSAPPRTSRISSSSSTANLAAPKRRARDHRRKHGHLRQLGQHRPLTDWRLRFGPQAQPAETQAKLLHRDHRPQRSLPLWLREKVQAVLREGRVSELWSAAFQAAF